MVAEADLDLVMLAGRWTLLDGLRGAPLLDRSGAPLLAAWAARGVAVGGGAPYNSGLLARDRAEAGTHFNYGQPSEDVFGPVPRTGRNLPSARQRLLTAALQFPCAIRPSHQ